MATLEYLTRDVSNITDKQSSQKFAEHFEKNEKDILSKIT